MPRWPHDDTRALVSFYGKPGDTSNLVLVKPPWTMTFDGKPIKGVQIHKKCAASLKRVFDDIAERIDNDWSKLPRGARIFDGSYNYRPVRGGSRPSCHSFGAAIDLDAEQNPMNSRGYKGTMSPIVINAFKREGWFWGGDFKSRKDPMHFQAAHEGLQVASLDETVGIAELPPETDAHADMFERDETEPESKSVIEALPSLGAVAGAVGTAAEITGHADTIITKVKPITRSRISIGAAGLGASSVATAAAAAPPTLLDQFVNIWKSPLWWLVVLNVGLTVYILYHYWADHGRGALRKNQDV